MTPLVVRKGDLQGLLGLHFVTVMRMEAAGQFPPRRQLSDGTVGWLRSEVEAWLEARPVATGGLRGEKTHVARQKAAAVEPTKVVREVTRRERKRERAPP